MPDSIDPNTQRPPTNADAAVRQYLAAGGSGDKIVLGVAFYGRGFAGVTKLNNGVNQPYERSRRAQLCQLAAEGLSASRDSSVTGTPPRRRRTSGTALHAPSSPMMIPVHRDQGALYPRAPAGGIMFWELSQDRDGARRCITRHLPERVSSGARASAALAAG